MRFSIITVSYNSSTTISRTIDSLLSQTFTDYEYIIIDGGSKDGTLGIIKTYQNAFSGKLKWISEPDGGIFPAMNKGIRMATGDLVGIVNSDDWLEKDALAIISDYYEKAGNDGENNLYCGAICYHYENGSQVLMPNKKMYEKNISRLLLKGIWHPATFVPLKIYHQIGLFDEDYKIMADSDFIYRIYLSGIHFILIPNIISNMSCGGASSSSINIYMADYKKLLKKYNYHNSKYYFFYIKEYIRAFIRYISPAWLVRLYRLTYKFIL